MTIRTRILVTQSVLAGVVLALSILVIQLANMSTELARMPTTHVDALARVHDLFDSAGQAVKDISDIAAGEEDAEELMGQFERVRDALARLRREAHDPIIAELGGELSEKFAELEHGYQEVAARVGAMDLDGARAIAVPLGEHLYEGQFRPLLERLQRRAVQLTEALRLDSEDRADGASRWGLFFVAIGVLGLIIGTLIVLRIRNRLSRLATIVSAMGSDIHSTRTTEDALDELGDLGRTFNKMADDVATMLDTTAAKEALAAELALASRMQQSLLPLAPRVPGLEIAGAMSAVSQVGGDYYDVLPTHDGTWIAIGDVSGHGFNTGVIMMLAQSAIASATRANPDARPGDVLRIVNDVLNDLVHARLHLRDHMALTLLRYRHDGSIEYAGAHQEILVRAAGGTIRTIETTGPWLAMMADIGPHIVPARFTLQDGETMVLFTDGVVEARVGADDMFGLDRLLEVVAGLPRDATAEATRDAVFERVTATSPTLDDDATVLVIRRPGALVTRAA